MATPVSIYPTATNVIPVGGEPIVAMYGPVLGGFVTNPATAADQGLAAAETLFVDMTGPAALAETVTTFPVQPGASFTVPANMASNLSVNAATAGHKFSGVIFQTPTSFPPTPQTGTFPPSGPTTLTTLGQMMSYLFKEYDDDADLQAFVDGFNSLAEVYVDWFANSALPIYTSPQIAGTLLDWVALGLYGMKRPALSSGRNRSLGPLNTYGANVLPPNRRKLIGPINVTVTTDDIFKRIITWNFYKGDGNVFNARWLKRRIMRFLIGENGTAPNIDQTYAISVIFGKGGIVTVRIAIGTRTITGGAFPNRMGPNSRIPLGSLRTTYTPPLVPNPFPLESVLQEALETGVLQVPFQYTVGVII